MSQPTLREFSTVVDLYYRAAYEADGWTEALDATTRLFGGSRACIILTDPISGFRSVASVEDPEFIGTEALELSRNDMLTKAWLQAPLNRAKRYREMVDLDAFRQGDYSRRFFKPRDMDNGLLCVFRNGRTTRWSVDISRSKVQPEFERRDVDLLEQLAGHIRRAKELEIALRHAAFPGIANLLHAYMVVDGRGKVLELNQAAERLLVQKDAAVRVRSGYLRTTRDEDVPKLERLVAQSCAPLDDKRSGAGGMAMIAFDDTGMLTSRQVVSVTPLPMAGSIEILPERCALILIRKVEATADVNLAELVRKLFGLSPSNARLAAILATGLSLRNAAEQLNLSYRTARSYLEEIFEKTGTRRQTELIALLKAVGSVTLPSLD